jgi:hypothetical protein
MTFVELVPQPPQVVRQSGAFDGAPHRGQEAIALHGFGQVVVGASAHGLDRGLDAGLSGHDDHRQLRLIAVKSSQHFQTRDVTEAQIEADRARPFTFPAQKFGAPLQLYDPISAGLQPASEHAADRRVILDDHNWPMVRHDGHSRRL